MIKVFFLVYLQFFNPIDAAAAYGDHGVNTNPGNAMFATFVDNTGPYKTRKDCEENARVSQEKDGNLKSFCVELNAYPVDGDKK